MSFYIIGSKTGQNFIETTANKDELHAALGTTSNLAGHTLRWMKKTDFSPEQKNAVCNAVSDIKQHYTNRWNQINEFEKFFVKLFAYFSKSYFTPERIDKLAQKIFDKFPDSQAKPAKDQNDNSTYLVKEEPITVKDEPTQNESTTQPVIVDQEKISGEKLASQTTVKDQEKESGSSGNEEEPETTGAEKLVTTSSLSLVIEDQQKSKIVSETHPKLNIQESKANTEEIPGEEFASQTTVEDQEKESGASENEEEPETTGAENLVTTSSLSLVIEDQQKSKIVSETLPKLNFKESKANPEEIPGEKLASQTTVEDQEKESGASGNEEEPETTGAENLVTTSSLSLVIEDQQKSKIVSETLPKLNFKESKANPEETLVTFIQLLLQQDEPTPLEVPDLCPQHDQTLSDGAETNEHHSAQDGISHKDLLANANIVPDTEQEPVIVELSDEEILLETTHVVSAVNLKQPASLEDMILMNPEFKELQTLSTDVNQALLTVYKQYPMVEAVLNSAIVEITKDVQYVVHNCLMQAAKKGGELTVDVMFKLMSTRLATTVGEKSSQTVASLILNKLVLHEAFGGLNVAKSFNPIDLTLFKLNPFDLMKMLDLPLKIYLLDGIGKKMVENKVKEKNEQLDKFFGEIISKVDLKKYISNDTIGDNMQAIVQGGMDASYHYIKKAAANKLEELLSSNFELALNKMGELAKDNGYEKYYTLSKKVFGTLYSGTGIGNTFLGQLTEQLLLTPLSYVGKAAQLADQPFKQTKEAAFSLAWETSKTLINQTAKLVNQHPDNIASQMILYCYKSIVDIPKDIAGWAAQYKAQGHIKTISKKVRRELALALLPSAPYELVPYKEIFKKHKKPKTQKEIIAAENKLKVAEFLLLNHAEIIAKNSAFEAIQFADKKFGQFAFNKAVSLRNKIIGWANKGAKEDPDHVIDVSSELERIFNPEDTFNLEEAIKEFTGIIMGDLDKIGDDAITNLKKGWLAENPESYWITNKLKSGVAMVAEVGKFAGQAYLPYLIEQNLTNPCKEAKKKLEINVQIFIQDISTEMKKIASLEDMKGLLEEYKTMTLDEAATYVLEQQTQKIIHEGSVYSIHKNLGIPLEEARLLLKDKKEAPGLVQAAINKSAAAGQFVTSMLLPYDYKEQAIVEVKKEKGWIEALTW